MPQVLSIAIRSSDRMQRLINSLLDINRLEAGQPITNRKSVEVSPLIREAMDAIQPITNTKRQKVLLEVGTNLPKIWVDEDMIRRVLINLLENATKFTPVDGDITLGAKAEGDWVRVWVQDTGPGIPLDAQDVNFQQILPHTGRAITIHRSFAERIGAGPGLLQTGRPGAWGKDRR